jgi:hypothetical protein
MCMKREHTRARAPVVVFFLLCRRRFARGETQSLRFSSLSLSLSVCNAMMDDHIALCVRRERERERENILFFFRIERFALTYSRKRERAKENNYATTNVQSRSKTEREEKVFSHLFFRIYISYLPLQ